MVGKILWAQFQQNPVCLLGEQGWAWVWRCSGEPAPDSMFEPFMNCDASLHLWRYRTVSGQRSTVGPSDDVFIASIRLLLTHEETSPPNQSSSQLCCCSKCSAVEPLLETFTLLMMPWGSGSRGQVSGWKVKLLTALITWPALSEVLQRSGLSCVYSDRCTFAQSLVLHEVKYSIYNHYIYLNNSVPCKYSYSEGNFIQRGRIFLFLNQTKVNLYIVWMVKQKVVLCSCVFFFCAQFCLDVNAEWCFFTHKQSGFQAKQLHQSLFNLKNRL